MAEFEAIFGTTLRKGKSEVNTVASLSDHKFTGVYFGAHWAPPCRLFNGNLAEFYTRANEAGKNF